MIRARCKKPEDIEARFVCCPETRAKLGREAGTVLELADGVFVCHVQCARCGKQIENVPFRRIVRGIGYLSAIALPFVDLDEGK